MIRRPPRSTLFPYRRSSDLRHALAIEIALEAVADRLVEENARPAGAQHDRHRPGRRFHRRELEARLACRRSEEHTSELQSRLHLVCRLLLENKKYTPRDRAT